MGTVGLTLRLILPVTPSGVYEEGGSPSEGTETEVFRLHRQDTRYVYRRTWYMGNHEPTTTS